MYEVWVSHKQFFQSVWDDAGAMRANAAFETQKRAQMECDWYVERWYVARIKFNGVWVTPEQQRPLRPS